jgi:transcriptional regulator with XRE-family HTH domain
MALAGMNQDELASAAGIARPSLTKILNDEAVARDTTLKSIRQALETRNIEFTSDQGVRLKPHGIEVLTGQEGLQKFFDGVYDHARQHGGTIVQFGVDERQFLEHLGSEFSANYVKRMTSVSRERKDLIVRAIVSVDDVNLIASDYNEYRWISKKIFQAVPFYICGETLAIMDFQTIPAPTIVLLKFPAITNAYRKQFEAFWEIAGEPSQDSHKRKD